MIKDYIKQRRERDEETVNIFNSSAGQKEIIALGVKPRDAEIFLQRIKEHKKRKEIAADYNLTPERIRQIINKVRRKILRAGH